MSKVGRPTKYKPEYCELLIEHMKTGLSIEAFAGVVSVAKDTIYGWLRNYSEFSDARKIGDEKSRLFWEKLGVAGAAGKIQGFNVASYIFNKKNRFPNEWRDKQEIEQTTTIQIATPEELIKISEAMKEKKLLEKPVVIDVESSDN